LKCCDEGNHALAATSEWIEEAMVIVSRSGALTEIHVQKTIDNTGPEGTPFLTVNYVMERAMQHESQPHQTHGKEKTHESQTSLQ
jgi:hypothetical protein